MLNFRPIERKDINGCKKYYDYTAALGCDTNLLGTYLWRSEYNIRYAVHDDTLIKAYFKSDEAVWGYCLPVGKNVKKGVEMIFGDCRERGGECLIVMLTNGGRARLEADFPGRFSFERSPQNQDYIYLSRDLATLSGKKFHAKRNHISKFYRSYSDVRFETLCSLNAADAVEVARKWCAENGINPKESGEFAAISEMSAMLDEFDVRGAVLYVDSKPAAMTMGSEISPRVFDINFEKALREYDGIYSVINNEFAKTLTSYEYINREEDMGLEGLRKSKLSYNPAIILDRWNASLLTS